jgi:hypothetical protein
MGKEAEGVSGYRAVLCLSFYDIQVCIQDLILTVINIGLVHLFSLTIMNILTAVYNSEHSDLLISLYIKKYVFENLARILRFSVRQSKSIS